MTADFEQMTKQWQDLVMESYSAATKQTIASDAFAAASSACLDYSLSWQKQMRDQSGQLLDALEIPKRSDVARLSKQLMAAEERIADCEDKMDEMLSLLKIIGQQREAADRRRNSA